MTPKHSRNRWSRLAGRLLAAALLSAGCAGSSSTPPARSEPVSALVDVNWELDVRPETIRNSVHAKLDCSDCHADLAKRKLDENGKPMDKNVCRGCHEKADAAYASSVHGSSKAGDQPGAARCQDCHGAHDVYAANDRRSRLHKRNIVRTCVKCHANPLFAKLLDPKQQLAVGEFAESIHGKELIDKGMLKAPSCVDCHGGGHEITAIDHADTKERKDKVMAMCSGCHEGIREKYMTSAHGEALSRGDADAPTCASCHTAHAIKERAVGFKLQSDRQCGGCHEERLEQHLGTYHGRAHALGGAEVAACFDCHGNHDVRPASDPMSLVSAENKLATCQKCHEKTSENMAGYLPHGTPTDRGNYPTLFWTSRSMSWLIGGAFLLFVLHTLVWSGRALYDLLRDPTTFREERRRRALLAARRFPMRFRGVDRFSYALLLVSFVVLLTTGMPLGYSQDPWAQTLFGMLGGADVARAVHRFGAILTVSYVALHLASLIAPLWRYRAAYRNDSGRFSLAAFWRYLFGEHSPLLNQRDMRNIWTHMKMFVGRGPAPEFERYTYWEKIDYLAMFFGISVIGASGFVLWAPAVALSVLPGWAVNVAQVIHREQAFLLLVFIMTAHICHLLPRTALEPLPSRSRAPHRAALPASSHG